MIKPNSNMRSQTRIRLIVLAALLSIFCAGSAGAQTLNDAVKEFRAGNVKEARRQLRVLDKKWPGNSIIKLYLASSSRKLGDYDEAIKQYKWVARNGDERYRLKAEEACKQLSAKSGKPYSAKRDHVATIYEFYTKTCVPCKKFAPVFKATAKKFPGIKFVSLDAEAPENKSLVRKYSISGYPRVVFLDGRQELIYSGFVDGDSASFEALIRKYR